MLCYVMLWYVRYVMFCYVNCVDCQFYRGASGTLRATRHAAELESGTGPDCLSVCLTESDGTRCEDLTKVTWRRDGGGGAICVRQQKRGRANTRRTGGEVV